MCVKIKPKDSALVAKARDFATACHGAINQKRRYTGDPYIVHPRAVARWVQTVPHDEYMLAAAWLHDVVEDTPATFAEVRLLFGERVYKLVESLTDISQPEDGNRATRKAIDRDHLAKASPDAKTIKLADMIDNSISICENDRNFAKTYLKEKRELLKVLKEGDKSLYNLADVIVEMYLRRIEASEI